MNLELVIAAAALALSLFGAIVPWYQKGQARLTLRCERYASVTPNFRDRGMRDTRLVIENAGTGDAYNVELAVFDQNEEPTLVLDGPTVYEWIPPGHSVEVQLLQVAGSPPAARGRVIFSHGRFATNPAKLRLQGKQVDLWKWARKLPSGLQRFHRNRRVGFEVPLTPHELP